MLAIGELVARTGVREATLRMWEHRHGFPAPQRLESGHRRYRETEVRALLAGIPQQRTEETTG